MYLPTDEEGPRGAYALSKEKKSVMVKLIVLIVFVLLVSCTEEVVKPVPVAKQRTAAPGKIPDSWRKH